MCVSLIPALAQDHITLKGRAYLDYEYIAASPDEDEKGENGFGYRRLYLTTDYKFSDNLKGRARLEAKGSNATPFVKDLYLQWSNVFGDGHSLVMGVAPPPAFEVAESVWGYRSLQKTIMDRNKIVSSRDFGIRANGNLSADGSLRYGVMIANNTSRDETDKYKRVYGQLEWAKDNISFTAGTDYAAGDESNRVNFNAFGGYSADDWRLGIEGVYNQTSLDASDATVDVIGLSAFFIRKIKPSWEFVGRVDQVSVDIQGEDSNELFILLALSHQLFKENKQYIRLIPNVLMSKFSDLDDIRIAGRMTLEMQF